jgi:DNA-binding CsgD family transcriptional regulator
MLETIELNANEWRLLQALNNGASNKDLALAFTRSEYTIRNQLSFLYKKLNVTNRMHAIFWYRENVVKDIPVETLAFVDRRQGPANDRRKANRQLVNAEASDRYVCTIAGTDKAAQNL